MTTQTLTLLLAAAAFAPLLSFAIATPATQSNAAGPDAARVQPLRQPDKQIVFKKTPQAELKLFAYLPPDWKPADKRPAILFFFGGGWRIGNPTQFFSKAEYFASRGLVAICAEYRISSVHQTSMKECVEDARSAMRYLRKNAADWGVDPDKIIASGGSSGGHLAASLCLDSPNDPADDLAISTTPNAMVLFNPVLDLLSTYEQRQSRNIVSDRIPGATEEDKKKLLAQLSPIEHLKKDAPPALVFFGDKDDLLSGTRNYAKKSAALGNKIEILIAPNCAHGFFNAQPRHTATLIKSDEFLATLGYLKGPSTLKPDANATLSPDNP